MAGTTTNFGWTYPTNTDYVKDGATAMQTIATSIDTSLNSLTGTSTAWQNWTPTFTNLTVGNGTLVARYSKINKTVNFEVKFTLGSTSSISSNPTMTLPVTGYQANSGKISGFFEDAGSNAYIMFPNTSSALVVFYAVNAGGTFGSLGTVSATSPFTWTTNDFIALTGSYEAA